MKSIFRIMWYYSIILNPTYPTFLSSEDEREKREREILRKMGVCGG